MQLEPAMMAYLQDLAESLKNAKRGSKGVLMRQASQTIGRSEQWVYDQFKELGLQESRKRRSDSGASKVDFKECQAVSNIMFQSNRDNGKQLMSLKLALEVAKQNGVVRSDVSTATLSREMKVHYVHPDQIKRGTPHRQVRSLYPNHVWQFDVSVCVLYYLKKSEGLHSMPADEFYKNKPENVEKIKNDRVLRYLVTDHYSGTFYVEYFNTPGENAETLIEFLLNAFSKRDGDPLHGVPTMLVWDAGTANQSNLVKGMLDRLDVVHHAHEVGSPRAKGQVERTHNLVECEFEGRLSMCQVDSIEQLNEQAQEWAKTYNGTVRHSRHKHTRYGLWQTIKEHQLRICPPKDLCRSLLQKIQPETRKVKGDLTIDFAIKGFGSNSYSVECIADVGIGETVLVTYNPYKAPSIVAIYTDLNGEDIEYNIVPIEKDAAGFDITAPVYGENYKTQKDTPAVIARKAMNKAAYGVETDREVKMAKKARKPAFTNSIDPFADVKATTVPDFMPRRGKQLGISIPKQGLDIKINYAKAVPMIANSLEIEMGSEEMKRLNKIFKMRYPEGMPEVELMDFTQEMKVLLCNAELSRVENGE